MKSGLSFESFGPRVGVYRATLYNWCKEHPEFLDAKNVGRDWSLLFWEQMGIDLMTGKYGRNAQAAPFIFTVKNRHPDKYCDDPIPEDEDTPDGFGFKDDEEFEGGEDAE